MKKLQKGFTLIELVVVIIILGILAAFLLPRFAGIERESRIATVQGLEGSIRGATAIVHATAVAQGIVNGNAVTPDGNVTVTNAYPTADAAGIGAALASIRGFTQAAGVFTKDGAPNPATCSVTYAASVAGATPVITLSVAGC